MRHCSRFAQRLAYHPQIAQCKQRRNLGSFFRQPPISRLHVAKLLFEDPEGMFNLRMDACFQPFDFVWIGLSRIVARLA